MPSEIWRVKYFQSQDFLSRICPTLFALIMQGGRLCSFWGWSLGNLIAWSHGFGSGRLSKDSLENTEWKSQRYSGTCFPILMVQNSNIDSKSIQSMKGSPCAS